MQTRCLGLLASYTVSLQSVSEPSTTPPHVLTRHPAAIGVMAWHEALCSARGWNRLSCATHPDSCTRVPLQGGAIGIYGATASLSLTSCTLYGNKAEVRTSVAALPCKPRQHSAEHRAV